MSDATTVSIANDATIPFVCCSCGVEKQMRAGAKNRQVPNGWKRLAGSVYCPKCWANRYVLRSIVIPVLGPIDCDWPTLREKLREAWALSTSAANWLLSEYYARDTRREPGMAALPRILPVYLYPQLRQRFPDLPSAACNSLRHYVWRKYIKARYDVIWICKRSLGNFRFPVPFPLPARYWFPKFDEKDGPTVSVRLPKQRLTLQLRRGFEFRRQLAVFHAIVDGKAIPSELALYQISSRDADGRNGCKDGGGRVTSRVMCKMAVWLPRDPAADLPHGVLFVRTDSESLLIALDAKKNRLWIKHADRVRDWQYQHRRWLKRIADDSKFERRFPRRRRMRTLLEYRLRGEKYRSRLDTFIHQVTAEVIGYASRRKFASIRYDDSDNRYLATFPWQQMRSAIATKAASAGLAFEHVRIEDPPQIENSNSGDDKT